MYDSDYVIDNHPCNALSSLDYIFTIDCDIHHYSMEVKSITDT